MTWIIVVIIAALGFWATARFYLSGRDLSGFDLPAFEPVNRAPSQENDAVLASVREFAQAADTAGGRRERLERLRQAMEAMGEQADLTGVTITPVSVAGRPAEWVTADAGNAVGRLLYLHGGAFTMGSPLSHRGITSELARRAHLDVLAIDYRLMPEHPRLAGIEDSRGAYRWILEHGPDGAGASNAVFVAGDSAGGNLALALIAWVRDQRRAGDRALSQVDGAIALSPLTDATFASPSLAYNLDHDPMLGPMVRQIMRIPRSLMLWGTWLQNRLRPSDPLLSPVRGDLADLPPVLVQASEAEILIDDARRYVNKARHSGSPAELETWHGMVHVWQAFGQGLPESEQAFDRMAAFVRRILETRGQADAA